MDDPKQSILTDNFLRSVARRLSGRGDCRLLEYNITIQPYDDENDELIMNPWIWVYPDRHHRKDSYKQNIIPFIVSRYFQEDIILQISPNGSLLIPKDTLVDGSYRYKKYKFSQKDQVKTTRKWIKL